MPKQPTYRPTFIRAYRKRAGLSLDELAEKADVDKGNLSKLERGFLPYKQDVLERLSAALEASVEELLTRDPSQPTPIWSYIDSAEPSLRRQIEEAAAAVYRAGKR
jgi:transcriptional regulator with XRE-family HTH domain